MHYFYYLFVKWVINTDIFVNLILLVKNNLYGIYNYNLKIMSYLIILKWTIFFFAFYPNLLIWISLISLIYFLFSLNNAQINMLKIHFSLFYGILNEFGKECNAINLQFLIKEISKAYNLYIHALKFKFIKYKINHYQICWSFFYFC